MNCEDCEEPVKLDVSSSESRAGELGRVGRMGRSLPSRSMLVTDWRGASRVQGVPFVS